MKGTLKTMKWGLAFLLAALAGEGLLFGQAADRRGAWGYIGFSPMSAHPASWVAPPLEAGAYLGDDWLLSAEYAASNPNFGHEEDEEEECCQGRGWGHMLEERWESLESRFDLAEDTKLEGRHQSYGARLRWFGGESWYLGYAWLNRNLDADVTLPASFGGTGPVGQLKAQAQMAEGSLGSQWIIGPGLTLGIDWLVGATVLQSEHSASLDSGQGLSTTEEANARAELLRLAQAYQDLMASAGGLRLRVGWSF